RHSGRPPGGASGLPEARRSSRRLGLAVDLVEHVHTHARTRAPGEALDHADAAIRSQMHLAHRPAALNRASGLALHAAEPELFASPGARQNSPLDRPTQVAREDPISL